MEDDATPAFRDGWHAHRLGEDVEENPYDERKQAYSHAQWMSGWCRRFGVIKHGETTAGFDEIY